MSAICASPTGAQSGVGGRVCGDILGVRIGSTLAEARARLGTLGTLDGRDTRDGGRKETVTLNGGRYGTVAFRTDASGRVVWVTGFVRPGQEIPFEELGERKLAARWTESAATWDPPGPTPYRVLAKGSAGKARVVTLLLVLPADLERTV
jgi:hypothetical protein